MRLPRDTRRQSEDLSERDHVRVDDFRRQRGDAPLLGRQRERDEGPGVSAMFDAGEA